MFIQLTLSTGPRILIKLDTISALIDEDNTTLITLDNGDNYRVTETFADIAAKFTKH